jgi:PilZ domain
MQSPSGLAASPAPVLSGPRARVHYRHSVHSLVYVTLDEGNGGIIRNLSESGAAVQAVGPLRLNQSVRMRFDLLNPKTRVDAHAEVAWANPGGQAGVRFVGLAPQVRRQLNDWIFANLLRGIEQASPVLVDPGVADDLILSLSARPSIRLPRGALTGVALGEPVQPAVALPWWPKPIPARTLAGVMDGLVLFSAVLIFFCVFLGVAHSMPSWPVALGLVFGVGGFFTALYWYLFAVMGRGTAGVLLTRLATGDIEAQVREREARFR